jgi:hypothetical protein
LTGYRVADSLLMHGLGSGELARGLTQRTTLVFKDTSMACGVSRGQNFWIRRCGTLPCARGGRDRKRAGRAADAWAPCDSECTVYFVGTSHTVEWARSVSEYAMARRVTDTWVLPIGAGFRLGHVAEGRDMGRNARLGPVMFHSPFLQFRFEFCYEFHF